MDILKATYRASIIPVMSVPPEEEKMPEEAWVRLAGMAQ